VRWGTKTLIAVAAALLLAVGLAACGGGDDSGSTATEASAPDQGGGNSKGGASSGGDANGGGGKSGSGQSGGSGNGSSSSFVPKHHDDSGGGSKQFEVKGGDNTIQGFGEEAEPSESEKAAAALHNFLDARAAEDWDATCYYLARGIIEPLKKIASQTDQPGVGSCAGILEKLTNPAAMDALRAEAANADVGSVRIEGARGFVIYHANGKTVFAMPMVYEDGRWKVGALAGAQL
jgi:hypothetical protein